MNGGLKKTFSTKDALALAFGTMIGWGWIMLSGTWALNSGMLGAMLAFVVGGIMSVFIGLAYAELTPMFPATGGGIVYAYKSMGYWPAVISGLAASFAYLGVAAWEGPAFSSAIDYIVPIPKICYLWTIRGQEVYFSSVLVAISAAILLIYINIRGAEVVAKFQTASIAIIILIGVLFALGSFVKGDFRNTAPLVTNGSGFLKTLLMVPAMFVGFDVIPQTAGEMNIPLKKIPKLLIVSIFAAASWYVLMIFATCMSAPHSVRATGTIPVADSMAYAFGSPFWGKICIIGALFGIVTSWNGFLFAAARCIYAMSNARMFPAVFGKLNPKYHTPANAVILCGTISVAACFLGKGALEWFVNASSFSVIIMYLMVDLAFIVLRIRQPELNRPYKVSNFKLISILAVLSVAFSCYVYLPFGPSSLVSVEWLFVIGWFALGGLLSLFTKLKYKDLTSAERENLLMEKS